MVKLSLTKRVTFLLFSLIFILGLFISFGVTRIIENHTLQLVTHITGEYAKDILSSSVSPDFFAKPLTSEDYTHLSKVLGKEALTHNVVRIKIWDKNGTILYSDDKNIIGKTFSVDNNLQQALGGKTTVEMINSNKVEPKNNDAKFDKLIEVNVPIKLTGNNSIIGAYELFWDFSEVSQSIKHAYQYIWLLLSVGFTVIFFAVYTTTKAASRTLDSQSKAINNLTGRLKRTLEEQLSTLIAALDAKDNYTAGHSLRVADYSLKIGQAIGMTKDRLKTLEQAALLHDIGKIGVPEQVLNKPGSLTEEEFALIKQHPATGASIIQRSADLSAIGEIIRYHHERYDGKGYPDGLQGEEIPLESRIMAVADTFDAMITDRPYRKGIPVEKAISILDEVKGNQLDSSLVDTFLHIIS